MTDAIVSTVTPAAGAVACTLSFDAAGAFDRYIRFIDASAATVETYTRAVNRFWCYCADHGLRGYPTRDDVISYRDHLRESCAPATVRLYLVALRRFFEWCVAEDLAVKNPVQGIKGGKVSREHKKDCPTAGQVKRIMKCTLGDGDRLQQLRDYAVLALMATCGLRCAEVCRADLKDLGTKNGIPAIYLQRKGSQEKDKCKKIKPQVDDAIHAYLAARGPVNDDAPLFASLSNNNRGGRMTTRAVSALVKSAMVNAGYSSKRLTAHSIRHFSVTASLRAGKRLEQVQQFADHANIETTLIYSHAVDWEENDCEAAIAAQIFD